MQILTIAHLSWEEKLSQCIEIVFLVKRRSCYTSQGFFLQNHQQNVDAFDSEELFGFCHSSSNVFG